uniref:VWFA domain-containing protein n=1 Tax=Panagrellus redivivus TaxID=6233 RepID=A0A7E4VJ10_PANRE
MRIRLLIAAVLTATATVAQNISCDVQPTGFYSECKVDLSIVLDASIAMVNQNNVNALIQSIQNLLAEYVYGEVEVDLLIFGYSGGCNYCTYHNNYHRLCLDLKIFEDLTNSEGLYNSSLTDILNFYITVDDTWKQDPRNYQNVLILLTAIDDEKQVADALPIAAKLRNEYNVQIITVTVGKSTSEYLPQLATESFVSPSFDLEWDLISEIANTSCINSGVTYPPPDIPTLPTEPLPGSTVGPYLTNSPSPYSTGVFTTTTVRSSTEPPWTDPPGTTTTYYPPSPTPSSPYVNDGDGPLCAANHKQAWLDLVFVIEHSSVTFAQWNAISSSIMSTISQLTLSNTPASGHTSRVAVITYDLAGTKLQFEFTAEQTTRNVLIALNKAKPLPYLGEKADIAGGLKAAGDYLTANPSFRVPGVVLYAATYDDSNTNEPITASDGLKADLIKIATVSFDAANGVSYLKISKLASPGLDSTMHSSISELLWAVSQLNCRCAHGWNQLTVANISYADCFFYQDASAFQAFTLCENTDTDILALANTPARVDFIGQLVSKQKPTNVISVGLSREDNYSAWTWEHVYPYYGYPAFAQYLSDTDVYGYLSKSSSNTWQLLADDGMTTGRFYVCQRRSGDTDNIVDL